MKSMKLLRQIAEDAPAPAHVHVGEDGDPWFEFSFSYEIDGAEFCFTVWARSFDDAERRLRALKSTARLGGQILSSRAIGPEVIRTEIRKAGERP